MRFIRKLPSLIMGLTIALGCQNALPDDIDIFTGLSAGAGSNVNVLIVLDNTSNWSRQAQKWPENEQQGQSEVSAIKQVVNTFDNTSMINLGMMEFTTVGTANQDGGFIRYNINPMSLQANRDTMSGYLDQIYNNITDPTEKRNSNTPYGDLMWDVYNYLAGATVTFNGAGTPTSTATHADIAGYTTNYSRFRSPLDTGDSCARTVIIFIGNADQSGPSADTSTNSTGLTGLGGTVSPQLQVPNFTTTTQNVTTNLGFTSACLTSPTGCSTADYSACTATPNQTYDSCQCSTNAADTTSSLAGCSAGTYRFDVSATGGSTSTITTTQTTTNNGTSSCYTGSGGCSTAVTGGSEKGGLSCPANTDTGVGSNPRIVTTYSCTYACGTTGGGSCPNSAGTPGPAVNSTGTVATSTGASTGCYASGAACTSANDKDGLTCPVTTGPSPATCSSYPCTQTTTTHSCSYACGTTAGALCTAAAAGSVTKTACSATKTNSPASITACTNAGSTTPTGCDANTPKCPPDATHTYSCPGTTSVTTGSQTNNSVTCPGNGSNRQWPINRTVTYSDPATAHYSVTQTDTPSISTLTTPGVANYTYGVVQTVNKTVATTTNTASSNVLGNTFGCYSSLATCSTADYSQCSVSGTTCTCTGSGTSGGNCPNSKLRYQVQGIANQSVVAPTNPPSYSAPAGTFNADEWAKFLHQIGVPAPTTSGGTAQRTVDTYTIDVFNAQQNAEQTRLLLSMANVGGGKYFAAKNKNQIISALKSIFAEIQAVNSAFASASLPVSATARTQDKNQVFIGMFRPDPQARPRWFGNVKQYKVVKNSSTGQIELGDSTGAGAINTATGFITDCAKSFWTSDETPPYWTSVSSDPPARGACTTSSTNPFSDSPDGPQVEKGATAEVIRKGNNPPSTDTTPTFALNRVLKTLASGALANFNAANTGLPNTSPNLLVDFTSGKDTGNENNGTNGTLNTQTRPSIHGDVVHSRPLAIDYGSSGGTVVYYGSNDGYLHSVNASTGKENWAFIAPEFFTVNGTATTSTTRLDRLKANSPLINYPNVDPTISPTPIAKDYFWDGLIGAYQKADNSVIWIYPAMRRGGRMLYAFDVSPVSGAPPTAPVFKWRFGCPNLNNDTGCAAAAGDASATSAQVAPIGQTWSFPNAAFIKGYSTTTPVVAFGGGYDNCEDANSTAPGCGSTKGNAVFILDGNNGTLLKSFSTSRSVVADVAFVDVDLDSRVDYAYIADTGGSVYRIDFIDGPNTKVGLAPSAWTMRKIAYTSGGNRKFFFRPALFQASASIIYLALGSGDREHPLSSQYPYTTPVTNRFYVFKDDLTASSGSFSLDDTTKMVDESTQNACGDATTILPSSTQKGYFISLTDHGTGEQVVTSALIEAGFADFSTNRPIPPNSASCSTPLGEARGYKVNLLNGSGVINVAGFCGGDRSGVFAGGGLPPSPVLATVPLDDGTPVTVAIGTIAKNSDCIPSPLSPCKVTLPIQSKRRPVYWMKSSGDQ